MKKPHELVLALRSGSPAEVYCLAGKQKIVKLDKIVGLVTGYIKNGMKILCEFKSTNLLAVSWRVKTSTTYIKLPFNLYLDHRKRWIRNAGRGRPPAFGSFYPFLE